MPVVDIVIPSYNRADLLQECIEKIESTTSIDYRLTVIDDCSPDKRVQEYIKTLNPKVNKLRNHQNMGFPKTVNKAVRSTYNDYVCVLNQDVLPMPGWLEVLVDVLEQDKKVGVVGPLLLFNPNSPNGIGGAVQHAGLVFNVNKMPIHRFLNWPADHPKVQKYNDELQAVTGACMLIRRNVWNENKGLDESYGLGTFEDVTFCVKTKWLAYKVAYTPDAMLYHWVGASATEHPSGGYPIQQNYYTFMEKAGNSVIYDEWRHW